MLESEMSSFKLPANFHDNCRRLYELLTNPPFELRLARRIPPRQGLRRSPKNRLDGAAPSPSSGVYVFIGFSGDIAKVGKAEPARLSRFDEKYAWECKEAQRMARIIAPEQGGWIFEKSAADAEAEERKIIKLLMKEGHYLPGNDLPADRALREKYKPTQGGPSDCCNVPADPDKQEAASQGAGGSCYMLDMSTHIERIVIDPDICNGKPVVRGLRITVETILDYLSAGETAEEILRQHPMLEPEDIQACLAFASRLMSTTWAPTGATPGFGAMRRPAG